ncbi:hypothetical protein PM3016_560 [Paenibacillus mucilaginosus 3016]|uniref:DUF2142 domain-containing protein n=1 Tax=Paenibacillus mucilaginosus 3016 TaxID=1116391 RepID=H6NSY6_9BACL|nr:DUF2142 domain-containing protein [Paenibacillus mucilaginosus]AFC27527.1 hypothetical protein PM3016_560 [Paenibacillus mucilaginosus 3016]
MNKKIIFGVLMLFLACLVEIFAFNYKYFSFPSRDTINIQPDEIILKDFDVLSPGVYKSVSNDPWIENKINKTIYSIELKAEYPNNSILQFYFKEQNNTSYSENNSEKLITDKNKQTYSIVLKTPKKIEDLRIDLTDKADTVIHLKSIKLNSIPLFDFNILRFIIIITTELICLLLFLFIKTRTAKNLVERMKPHHIFLIASFVFGSAWLVLVPPFQAADEFFHFYRSYEISEGNFVSQKLKGQVGNYLPKSIKDFEVAIGAHTITRNYQNKEDINNIKKASMIYPSVEREFINFSAASVYHPIVYLPQAIGIKLGRGFNLSLLSMFYLGRLMNLIVYICITYLAIRLLPKLKYGLLLLAVMPMTINQAASLSADALTNAILFLFIAYIMYLTFDNRVQYISKKQFFLLLFVVIIVAASKNAYFFFCFLILIIPVKKMRTFKQFIISISTIIIACVTVVLSWAFIVKGLNITFPNDPRVQLESILYNPYLFIGKLINTFIEFDYLYVQFFGVFGWGETAAPYFAAIIFVILLVSNLVSEMKNNTSSENNVKQGIVLLFIGILSTVVIQSMLYLTWTQENGNVIYGLQGRYFIPIILIMMYSFYLLAPILKKINKQYIYILLIFIILLVSLDKVLRRFWLL